VQCGRSALCRLWCAPPKHARQVHRDSEAASCVTITSNQVGAPSKRLCLVRELAAPKDDRPALGAIPRPRSTSAINYPRTQNCSKSPDRQRPAWPAVCSRLFVYFHSNPIEKQRNLPRWRRDLFSSWRRFPQKPKQKEKQWSSRPPLSNGHNFPFYDFASSFSSDFLHKARPRPTFGPAKCARRAISRGRRRLTGKEAPEGVRLGGRVELELLQVLLQMETLPNWRHFFRPLEEEQEVEMEWPRSGLV